MTDDTKYDLKADIISNQLMMQKLGNDIYAQNLYAALCNIDWQKQEMLPMLEGFRWTTSWRGAGRLVSDLRNLTGNLCEEYMDYYCSGMASDNSLEENNKRTGYVSEGTVTLEIKTDLSNMGWVVMKEYNGN